MDELRIHQLSKEMVAAELRKLGDPCATAAEVVQRTLAAALVRPPLGTEAARLIEDTVRGAMTALLLADQSLSRGGLLILEAVLEITATHLEPMAAMHAVLKGLADMRRFATPERLADMRVVIGAKYMGAGEVFDGYLREPLAEPTPTKKPA